MYIKVNEVENKCEFDVKVGNEWMSDEWTEYVKLLYGMFAMDGWNMSALLSTSSSCLSPYCAVYLLYHVLYDYIHERERK